MDPQEKINILRNKIDDLDNQILDFLVQRFSISREIGEIKASSGIEIRDPDREKEIIERLANKLTGKLDKDDVASIFGPVYKISKRLQKNSVGYSSLLSLISAPMNTMNTKNYYSWYWFFNHKGVT